MIYGLIDDLKINKVRGGFTRNAVAWPPTMGLGHSVGVADSIVMSSGVGCHVVRSRLPCRAESLSCRAESAVMSSGVETDLRRMFIV